MKPSTLGAEYDERIGGLCHVVRAGILAFRFRYNGSAGRWVVLVEIVEGPKAGHNVPSTLPLDVVEPLLRAC